MNTLCFYLKWQLLLLLFHIDLKIEYSIITRRKIHMLGVKTKHTADVIYFGNGIIKGSKGVPMSSHSNA